MLNLKKHGIDFEKAQELWSDPDRVVLPVKNITEPRFLLIGKINDKHGSAIFTIRNQKIRIISVRRARKNEQQYYQS